MVTVGLLTPAGWCTSNSHVPSMADFCSCLGASCASAPEPRMRAHARITKVFMNASTHHPDHIRPGDDECFVSFEIADQYRGVLRRDHLRQQIHWRGDVHEREGRLHDRLDRLRLDVAVGEELLVQV